MQKLGQTNNVIAMTSGSIGGNFPVWTRKGRNKQGGGWVDVSAYPAGTVLGAGTMCIYTKPGAEVKIVLATDTDNLSKVNGLLAEDIAIPDGIIQATATVCFEGRIYADRVTNGIPSSVEAQLPMIEFVREA